MIYFHFIFTFPYIFSKLCSSTLYYLYFLWNVGEKASSLFFNIFQAIILMDDNSWQNRVGNDYFDVRSYGGVLLSRMGEFKDKENLNSFYSFKVC